MSKQELNTPQKSDVIRHDEKSVTISESRLLVPLAKVKNWLLFASSHKHSKRVEKNPVQSDEIPSSGLNKEANALLKAAQEQIDAKIDELMASYFYFVRLISLYRRRGSVYNKPLFYIS